LDYLTFQEYLNAVGRAFDSYKAASARDQLSLLDASERRWTLQPALVYNKGLLVAFLYDLTLRQETKGKRSIDDVYRELLRLYRAPAKRTDGNRAILSVLNNESVMREFTRRYIESASAIDLSALIAPFGLRIESGGVTTRLVVEDSLSGAQRDLLRKFGYNEKSNLRRRPAK
jgi:predicted metalloprotease with PDZ domain